MTSRRSRRRHEGDGRRRAARSACRRCSTPFHRAAATIRVLDPACGSGNFLYVVLRAAQGPREGGHHLRAPATASRLQSRRSDPRQLYGIEINAYAARAGAVVIWIGYLQWMHDNGWRYAPRADPEPLDHIERSDAVLDRADPASRRSSRRGRRPTSSSATRRSSAASCCATSLGDDVRRRAVRGLRRPRRRARPTSAATGSRRRGRRSQAGECEARRPARDAGHPRRREPPGAGAHQGDRRHLLRARPTASGSSTAPRSASRWSGSTTAPRRRAAERGHGRRCPRWHLTALARSRGSTRT